MTSRDPGHCLHAHQFHQTSLSAERKTRIALWITAIMMLVEIVGGWQFNSMALLADGWHMSSHTLALGLSLFAYAASRRLARDPRFSFGTWKIEILGGYTSAILLLAVAGLMVFQSLERLLEPGPIHYDEAIAIAMLGLLVNLLCAWLLRDDHHHSHDHGQHQDHAHHHHDLNLRSAYLHVIADAATSVLAIIALLAGKFWAAGWLDPLMGIVGAILVGVWAKGLLRDTGRVLLDAEMDAPLVAEVRKVIDRLAVQARITDLHLWRVGKDQYACMLSLTSPAQLNADAVRQALSVHEELVHVTVEINRCAT